MPSRIDESLARQMNSDLGLSGGFDSVVTTAAMELAVQARRCFTGEESTVDEVPLELAYQCLLFVLHLTDRVVYARLGPQKRDDFMLGLLTTLGARTDEQRFREDYAAAQHRYSAFAELLPSEGAGTRDTLFYEFAKSLCLTNNVINPFTWMLVSLGAADMFIALGETFDRRGPLRPSTNS